METFCVERRSEIELIKQSWNRFHQLIPPCCPLWPKMKENLSRKPCSHRLTSSLVLTSFSLFLRSPDFVSPHSCQLFESKSVLYTNYYKLCHSSGQKENLCDLNEFKKNGGTTIVQFISLGHYFSLEANLQNRSFTHKSLATTDFKL